MTPERETINIGMGEMKISKRKPITLCCIGLGSCIGLTAFDPISGIGGMAHMVLPEDNHHKNGLSPAKFVSSGIPLMLAELEKMGASRDRLLVKICGGARMFEIPGLNNAMDVGARNIDMAARMLSTQGIKGYQSDVGGNQGRTMTLMLETGKVFVKKVGQETVEL